MLSRRTVIENHLSAAKAALEGRTKLLTEQQFDKKKRKRDVTFRQLEAEVRKYGKRLKALEKVEGVNADLEARRAAKAAQPKVPKVKKKKVVEVKPKAKKEKKAAAGG